MQGKFKSFSNQEDLKITQIFLVKQAQSLLENDFSFLCRANFLLKPLRSEIDQMTKSKISGNSEKK